MELKANPNNNPDKLHRIIIKHPALTEGKVKSVYDVDAQRVMIKYRDEVTAFDPILCSEGKC